jgi:phospholipid/cholesterol/gamma-HCH transport system substrate-binding protein
VYAVSDTTIKVEFTVDKTSSEFITQNAIASITTDGLLGNKLVTISPFKKGGLPIQEGSTFTVLNAIKTDNAMRSLLVTNENLKVISENLKVFSNNFNGHNSIFHALTDTVVAENVRATLVNLKTTTNNTAIMAKDLSEIVQDVKSGKGAVGNLLTDTLFSFKLHQTIKNLDAASDSILIVSGNLKNVSEKMKNGNGAMAVLLNDTVFAHNLTNSMYNVKTGSKSFSEDMEALKHVWPFKKYFKTVKK